METIFLAEDNTKLANTVTKYLRQNGYKVFHRSNGLEAFDFLMSNNFGIDLIMLDIKMPDMDGLQICQQVRKAKIQIPVLMLTNVGDVQVIVQSLELGADDYLTKPFALAELGARIKALLRRPAFFENRHLDLGDLEIDIDSRRIRLDGRPVTLRRREFDVLYYLARNRNQMVSREQILLHVWNIRDYSFAANVDVHIRQIRQRFNEISPRYRNIIQTVYGFGYRLNVEG